MMSMASIFVCSAVSLDALVLIVVNQGPTWVFSEMGMARVATLTYHSELIFARLQHSNNH